MKKYLIYFGILGIGLLLGWLIFNNSNSNALTKEETSTVSKAGMWTCSMHPQIMKSEPGDCPICGMDLIPAESSSDGLNANEFVLTENAMALANVQTTIVGEETNTVSTERKGFMLSGKIQENEKADEVQTSHFAGRIERLNVNFVGETVRKGQRLATIYSPELVTTQQELISIASVRSSQPELYKAVRGKLKLWKLSEGQINQIENSGKVLDNFPVFANVSGTVSEMMAQQGDYVNRGQGLFKIDNLNSLWAIFDVYENQISQIKIGQPIQISTNAYPDKNFVATISFIYPTLDDATRTIKVRANISNNGNLKPGMFVQGQLRKAETNSQSSLTIPASAVLWTGKRSVVYVKTDPKKSAFEMREVQLGTQSGEFYSILSGLESGEEIVTNGTFTIDAAAQLQGKKSMMNRESTKKVTGHENHTMEGQSKTE